jgi:hypothetical protein
MFEKRAMKVGFDSQSEIFLAKNPAYHSNTKHIDEQYHFVRDMVESNKVVLEKVDKLENITDSLTKSMSALMFSWCKEAMGIVALGMLMKFQESPISAKKTISLRMLSCYILCSESLVEVNRLMVEGRGGSTTSQGRGDRQQVEGQGS